MPISKGRVCAAALGLALICGDAAQAEKFDCLWDSLATADKARLELDARIGVKPLKSLFDRRGSRWFSQYLSLCEFSFQQSSVTRVGHYLAARAGVEITRAELVAFGLREATLNAALDAEAKPTRRRALAQEILEFDRTIRVTGPAVRVVRAIAKRLENAPADGLEATRRDALAQNWATNQILVDGLAAGAKPPQR